jgi:hypothetical protein
MDVELHVVLRISLSEGTAPGVLLDRASGGETGDTVDGA